MELYTLDKLSNTNYNPVFINALRQNWKITKSFQCINSPKKQNLFLFLDGCQITYTDKDGNIFIANSGDVVYTPIGSEYKAQITNLKDDSSHTIGINFFLFDDKGQEIILSDGIKVFTKKQNKVVPMLFKQALNYDPVKDYTKNRILVMEILSSLTFNAQKEGRRSSIEPALSYLSEHIEESPTISMLASLCHISEVYFRKQFKIYMGVTPVEYRNFLRLKRAKLYLEYGEISVQEVSDILGYSTVSHFIKEFKRQYGCSPLKCRKLHYN